MSAPALLDRLLDIVVATNLDAPDEDFVAVGFSMLALAISRLEPAERETTLQAIENAGALRQAVDMFPSSPAILEVPNGYLN